MANKARYYGIVTKEQEDSKKLAEKAKSMDKSELTRTTLYSAMSQIDGIEDLSAQKAVQRLKNFLIKSGFDGKLTTNNGKISDNKGNEYAISKTKRGMYITHETHEERKREK